MAIYKSFMEIYSPGKFPENRTPEMFITGIHQPIRRNPLITRTLYYSKDMESFATGLKRIQEACNEISCKVEYYIDDYGFTVRFYRHCGEKWNTKSSKKDRDGALNDTLGTLNGTLDATPNGTQYAVPDVVEINPYKEKILEAIRKNHKITRKQMAKSLSVSVTTVQRILNSMTEVQYIGVGKSGHWEIIE